MTTVENVTVTPVELGGTRGGPDGADAARGPLVAPAPVTATVLIAFVIYATWAAFVNKDYYVGAAITAT